MISLVVPVLDEEATVPIFHQAVRGFDGLRGPEVEIVFVNDGSRDNTAAVIRSLVATDSLVRQLAAEPYVDPLATIGAVQPMSRTGNC